MEQLGTVVRLQVQRSRLKPGARDVRVYDPTPLLEVDALDVGPRGVVGVTDAGPVLDVHHADHPDSRHRGVNGLSLLPRAHYATLRGHFGDHLVDGAAAESLLLETDRAWTLDDLAGPLRLETAAGGLLELTAPAVAAPCLEFSRFCLGRGREPDDQALRSALEQLGGGARGFYVTPSGSARIERGARLLRG
ncbi:MAG: hypothetical protein WD794_13575 [Mycobacteriales bacterium]